MSKKGHAARMRRLVARWRASEESGASFAQRHGVTPWAFWYWCRKVTEESAAAAPPLVPVHVLEPDGSAGVEVVLSSGDRVKVTAGASADLVRTVVAALRSA